MSQIDPITSMRLATLVNSEFKSEGEMIAAVDSFFQKIGNEMLDREDLSEAQAIGIRRALIHTPWTISHICRMIAVSSSYTSEQRSNIVFMFAKLLDDALTFGYIANESTGAANHLMENEIGDYSAVLSAQATLARSANSDKAKERLEHIKTAVLEVANGAVLADSDKFAESIEDSVRSHLHVDKRARGYSRRSIQRAVKAILEERGKA